MESNDQLSLTHYKYVVMKSSLPALISVAAVVLVAMPGCEDTKPPVGKVGAHKSVGGDSLRRVDRAKEMPTGLPTAIFDILSTSDVAGFDTNTIQPIQEGNSLRPFMLPSHAKYYGYYRGLIQSPAFDSLQQRIIKDSARINERFQNGAIILGLGMPLSGHPPFAALLFSNDSSGILYWTALDTLAIKQLPLPHVVPGLLHAIAESSPGSVDEVGSEDDQFAFVAVVTPEQRHAVIWSPRESTLGMEYDQALIFKPKMPETGFQKRKMMDSLLSVVGKEADPRGWGEVW
jgi:hypothetical protein